MKFINSIKSKAIYDFKESYCDENITISHLLGNTLKTYLKPPILDVGAGIGDIAYKALAHKKVVLIDVNQISKHDYSCHPNHIRKRVDFFDYESSEQINTLLISHTLQFIDSDIELLNKKIKVINPETIVLIVNDNDDFMAEIIHWTFTNFENPNPELRLDGFPEGYDLIKSRPFSATLHCQDFETLAKQIAYLMLIELDHMVDTLIMFLRKNLVKPLFTINQTIEIYRRR